MNWDIGIEERPFVIFQECARLMSFSNVYRIADYNIDRTTYLPSIGCEVKISRPFLAQRPNSLLLTLGHKTGCRGMGRLSHLIWRVSINVSMALLSAAFLLYYRVGSLDEYPP